MNKIYSYTRLLEDVLKFKEAYSDKICVKIIGASTQKRLIPLIRIGNGSIKQLIVSSVHGREFVTSAFIMRCVKEFLEQGCEIKDKSFYVVPMLNPDGVEVALGNAEPFVKPEGFKCELNKNNANNINLNANFPFCFHKVTKNRQGGKKAATEAETKTLIRLCEEEKFSMAFALHARGNCIFWRDAGNGRIKDDYELSKALRNSCGFELKEPTKRAEDYSGGFENWFRYKYKKPALCIELVEDESMSFSDMCTFFEEAVIWEKTGCFLKILAEFT